jgi:type II secretory pathway pseudopilin PulG
MRLPDTRTRAARRRARCGQSGFSLTEMLIAGAIFMLVVAGVLIASLFGVRMLAVTEPKLAVDGVTRRFFDRVAEEVGSAWDVQVGSGDLNNFTPVPPGAEKVGNALQLYLTLDTNDYVRYYQDPGAGQLLRIAGGELEPVVLAEAVTNSDVFAGEYLYVDPATSVPETRRLTNDRNSMIVHVLLQYSALGGTATPVGPERLFKGHQFETRLTWRSR